MTSSRVPSQLHVSRSDAEAGEQKRHDVPLQAGRAAWLTMKAGSMLELDLAGRRVSRSPAHTGLVAGKSPTHQPASPGSRYSHVNMIRLDDGTNPTVGVQRTVQCYLPKLVIPSIAKKVGKTTEQLTTETGRPLAFGHETTHWSTRSAAHLYSFKCSKMSPVLTFQRLTKQSP